jgi:putative transposase
MPRRLRIHVPGGFYHVTLRGNHQRAIFRSDGDARLLSAIVARAADRRTARVHAYCWMSNHLHLLVQVSVEPLASVMRDIASEYARAMQSELQTTGHFFERRYHATLVDTERYLKEVVRYIHLNPVEAKLVANPDEHRWCSHHQYLGAGRDPWVTTDLVLQAFGLTRQHAVAAYRAFMEQRAVPDWSGKLEFGGRASDVLGDDAFLARIKAHAWRATRGASLDELVAEACRRYRVSEQRLVCPVRDAHLAKVRVWIATEARKRGIATLSAVARRLGRSEATLRQAMRAVPRDESAG